MCSVLDSLVGHIRSFRGCRPNRILCYDFLSHDRGIDPYCRLCSPLPSHEAPVEDIEHLLTRCRATRDTRDSRLAHLLNTIAYRYCDNSLLSNVQPALLTQFLLDCSSLNLPNDVRISHDHPSFTDITRQCSYYVYAIHKDRIRQLKVLGFLGTL